MTALAPSADTTAVHGPTADPAAARALMSAVLDAALDAVVAIDGGGRVVEWNPAAERIFGYRAADALGRELAALIVPAELRDRHRAGLARHVAGGPSVLSGRRIEVTARRASGARFPAELTITRVGAAGEPLYVAYVRDIGDRRRAEAQLRASRARIVAAADTARRRIERDLHDGAQQHLVALGATLRLARLRMERDAAGAAAVLDGAMDALAAATAELRELARGIHPVVLTEGGLEPALAGLAARLDLPIAIDGPPPERLAPEVEATAYYVVAEALTNVARHAGATRAAVSVAHAGSELVVRVHDNGRGGAAIGAGSGLAGLGDRVAALDGRFVVSSAPGAGTTVEARIPCPSTIGEAASACAS